MNTIGVVAVVDGGEMNLYFLEVLNGVLEAAARHGQNTTVFSLASWEVEESRRILEFCDGRVDGMLLVAPPYFPESFVEELTQDACLVMIHGDSANGVKIPNMGVDNEQGAYTAVRYLLAQGHRQIAHFAGEPNIGEAQQRLSGYRRALGEAGIAYDPDQVWHGNYSVWSGRHCMEQALQKWTSETFPTAIFCATDAIACGCMEALVERNVAVPDDISIVGFDDTLLARSTTPPLTTIRQPFRQMGRRAVERLLSLIGDDQGIPVEDQQAVGTNAQSRHADEKRDESKNTKIFAGLSPAHVAAGTEVFALELIFRKSVGPPRQNRPQFFR